MTSYTGVSWKVGQIRRFLKKKPYMTMADAAAKLDCSREYVRRLKNRFDLPFQRRPKPTCWVCRRDIFREGGTHQKCRRTPIATAARFWAQVGDRQDRDACWEWQGVKLPYGYGRFHAPYAIGGVYAHRAVWELAYGPVPDGTCVLHHCDNPPCVNPRHLFLGTYADNAHDRDRKGRHVGRKSWRKKICKRGHDRTDPKNIYEYAAKNGRVYRWCRKCMRK